MYNCVHVIYLDDHQFNFSLSWHFSVLLHEKYNALFDENLGPIHTYPDIFESATFSFRIHKFPRPHVAYWNRIHPSTRIRWYPDSL